MSISLQEFAYDLSDTIKEMQLEYAAVVSLMILCVNIGIKILFGGLKKRFSI